MNNQQQKWLYLILLSFIWGSSFILIKKALIVFTPVQVGALRMIITGIFLLLIGFRSIKRIQKKHWIYIFYTALLGGFFPSFLFAYAIHFIDSSIVSILNSFTPFNTLISGVLVFGFIFKKKQFMGILIGLVGALILILDGANEHPNQNYWFALLVMLASIGYAFNINIIKKYLSDLDALAITVGNFLLLLIPSTIVLIFTGFFSTFEVTTPSLNALGYIFILSVVGTGIARIVFNKLIHISTPVFSSSVTYLIPVVAVIWGVIDGEKLTLIQFFAGILILLGVYLVNKVK